MPYPPEIERDAVKKGAALLDRILPGWHNSITIETLNMGSGVMCMMGQLFGSGVESKLAREMYPEEMDLALKSMAGYFRFSDYCDLHGYSKALASSPRNRKNQVVYSVINKLGINDVVKDELSALEYVCDGHNTRCFWIEEIANRKAMEAQNDQGAV